MTKATVAPFSLADIEGQVATEATYEFEPLLPNLKPSGVLFQLKSDLAPSVQNALTDMMDTDRKKEHFRAAQNQKARPESVQLTPVNELSDFGRKAIAIRIAGWNLPDEFNEATVLRVLKAWSGLGDQILAKTAELASFTPASSKA